MNRFVDTNVFLRFLTRDDPEKAQACLVLFQQANCGNLSLVTSEAVIAEIVYVLSSPRLYNLPRNEIRVRLLPLIELEGLSVPGRSRFRRALSLWVEHSVDFEDALSVATMEESGVSEVYSYDRDFERFSDIVRLEP